MKHMTYKSEEILEEESEELECIEKKPIVEQNIKR